jgi:hypothetical protein
MNQESVSFRGLILSLAFYLIEEELRCHTLIFLSYNEILHCLLVSRPPLINQCMH